MVLNHPLEIPINSFSAWVLILCHPILCRHLLFRTLFMQDMSSTKCWLFQKPCSMPCLSIIPTLSSYHQRYPQCNLRQNTHAQCVGMDILENWDPDWKCSDLLLDCCRLSACAQTELYSIDQWKHTKRCFHIGLGGCRSMLLNRMLQYNTTVSVLWQLVTGEAKSMGHSVCNWLCCCLAPRQHVKTLLMKRQSNWWLRTDRINVIFPNLDSR